MVIVISRIFTLWLKLGFYSFHCHFNTITDNYNWSFAKKWRPFRFPKRVRNLKSVKKLWKFKIKHFFIITVVSRNCTNVTIANGNNIIDIAVIFRRPFKIAHCRLADSDWYKNFAFEYLQLLRHSKLRNALQYIIQIGWVFSL